MTDVSLGKQLRSLLSEGPNAPTTTQVLELVDAKVLEISASEKLTQDLHEFEEELQSVCDDAIDLSRPQHLELFLDVLYRAQPVLPSESLIITWFDLVLRPALREPRLSRSSLECAKELILMALDTDRANESQDKVSEFRRRVMDFYLLDAFNESSGRDILEWAELDEKERGTRFWWKKNLEDILVLYGLHRPDDFFAVLNDCFQRPASRLQLLILLDTFVSHDSFIDISSMLFPTALLSSVLLSLQVDNSSTLCSIGLSVLVKLLPVAAVNAYENLKRILPRLFGILGRLLCWKARHIVHVNSVAYSELLDRPDEALVIELERKEEEEDIEDSKESTQRQLQVRDELGWERLESSFDASSSVPSCKQYFALLYYLFPVNTIFFLRRSAAYLREHGCESPWYSGWDEALDDIQIRTASTQLLRSFVIHPSVVWYDAQGELDGPNRWTSYDVSRIVGECTMLDFNSAVVLLREEHNDATLSDAGKLSPKQELQSGEQQSPTVKAFDLSSSPGTHRVSLQEIMTTSATLKSGADIDLTRGTPVWPSILLSMTPPVAPSPSMPSTSLPPARESPPEPTAPSTDESLPSHVREIINSLQREALLLRNELQIELWLKRENMRHVGRLHHDRVQTRSADSERQQLHNKLREFKSQLSQLQKQLKQHQDQAQDMKQKHVEWSLQLQGKLNTLREEKKQWQAQATELKGANSDLKAHLAAQGKLLAEAQNEVFKLDTEIKANAHKVQRLRDYEKRIEQLTTMHRMWNKDILLFNEQSKMLAKLTSDYGSMKLQLQSYEQSLVDMEERDSEHTRRIQVLEASLAASEISPRFPQPSPADLLAAHVAEKETLSQSNEHLRKENAELRDEVEEMKAMVEVLKAQQKGQRGLIDSDIAFW